MLADLEHHAEIWGDISQTEQWGWDWTGQEIVEDRKTTDLLVVRQ